MIRKIMKLIENYDKIMEVIENYDKLQPITPTKKVDSKNKAYSLANTPKEQIEFIEKKMKGE